MRQFLFIFTFLPFTIAAQIKTWTLRQCIDTALQNNLTIQQSENQVKMSAVDLNQSRSNRFPDLNGTINQSFGSGRTLNPVTYQFTNDDIWGNQFSLNSSVTLFNGFQNLNTIKQSQVNYEKSQVDLESVKNDITLAVVNAYLQVLFANELYLNTKKYLEGTTAQVKHIRELFEAGLRPESDVLQIKAQMSSDKLSEINARNQLKTTKLILQQLMNVTPSDLFDIDYTPIPETPIAFTQDVNSIYREALLNQPVVQSSQLNTQIALYGVRKAKGVSLPSLSLNVNIGSNYSSASRLTNITYSSSIQNIGYLQNDPGETVVGPVSQPIYNTRDYSFMDQLGDNFNGALSLSLFIPIANKNQVRNNITQQQILLENAKLNEESVRIDLRKNIEQAYLDVENALERMRSAEDHMKATKASEESINDRYENGLVNITELMTERNKYIVAQSEHLQARYELLFRLKILDYYKGIPIDL